MMDLQTRLSDVASHLNQPSDRELLEDARHAGARFGAGGHNKHGAGRYGIESPPRRRVLSDGEKLQLRDKQQASARKAKRNEARFQEHLDNIANAPAFEVRACWCCCCSWCCCCWCCCCWRCCYCCAASDPLVAGAHQDRSTTQGSRRSLRAGGLERSELEGHPAGHG